jgi:hypothetical protein
MRDNGNIDDSICQKIEIIVVRMRSTMEALEIEGIESTTIIAREIIDAVQYETKKVMLLQGSAGTDKTHTVRVILSELHRLGIHCLVSATMRIAAVPYPGGKLFTLYSASASRNAKARIFSPMWVAVLPLLIIYYRPV